jgi:predicted NBD/HSP70 family sugar kinase
VSNGRRRIASTTDLGRLNAEAVLEVLYDREPRTNAELARDTGLSRSTVERVLELLVGKGVVSRSSDPVTLVSGRPAMLFRLRPEFGHLLAIDVGAHTVRARVDDLAGLAPGQAVAGEPGDEPEPVQVGPQDKADSRIQALEDLADQALLAAGITRDQVRAVTIASPGIIDPAGVIVSCKVIEAGDWEGDRLRTSVRERFPNAAVSVENDANLAVLAEQRFGVAGNARDVVAVSAGRRVGFGILDRGDLHRGAHNRAGEVAGIRDSSWGRASDWLYRQQDHVRDLFDEADAGRPGAVAAVGELAGLLGTAFAEIVHTIDPELIVLGGAISAAGSTILDPVQEEFERACRHTDAPPLLLSALGRRAVLLGAAEHARRQAFAHLLDEARPHRPNATSRSR